MKKLALIGGVLGLAMAALLIARTTQAAGRAAVTTPSLADIDELYAWTSADGAKLNLVLTISPADDGSQAFSPAVQYVFHVSSRPGLGVGVPATSETQILCTFASDDSAQCWVTEGATTKDYVTGDPSNPAGITSAVGKVRLFAGRRADPMFWNLQGLRDAVTYLQGRPALIKNAAGCPTSLTDLEVTTAVGKLGQPSQPTAGAPCSTSSADCFKALNVRAIVLQIDKALLDAPGNTVLGVWASTNAGTP